MGQLSSNEIKINEIKEMLIRINRSVSHRTKISIREKGKSDFVTDIDTYVEKMLINELMKIDLVPCITEESFQGDIYDSYWVIDPIDGTTNLIHKYPNYCISIAKVENNITILGLVYNLQTKELFIAEKGKGAFCINTTTQREKKLFVSKNNELQDSLIGFGCPYNKSRIDFLFERLSKILKECHDLKRSGPASLDICYVAAGRLDAYIELDLKEWDYRAGKLVLEEAGGIMTDWNSNIQLDKKSDVVASNGLIHNELMKYLQ